MRTLIAVMYLVSGFLMLSPQASMIDAPTLVVQEYSEHFTGSARSASCRPIPHAVSAVRSYLRQHMPAATPLKLERLSRLIVHLARLHHIDEGLILSIIKVESNFNPTVVSPMGAVGLMQLMPETGQWLASRYGIRWDGPRTLKSEEANIFLGVKYLSFLKEKYGNDLRMMLSAYNVGPAKVDEDLSNGRKIAALDYYRSIINFLPKFGFGHRHDQEYTDVN